MAVGTEVVAVRYEDIVAGTPISVPYPVYEAIDVFVYYGAASLRAVLNTDYTVSLADDFDTFTLTPTASLLAKINALIAADPTNEENYITVRRQLDYLTDSTAAAVRYTPFTSREFERTVLRFQQLEERLNRALVLSPNFVGNGPLLQLNALEPGASLRINAAGNAIEPGPQIPDINAQFERAKAQADRAEGEANYAEEWAQSSSPIRVQAGGDGSTDQSSKTWALRSENDADRSEAAADNAQSYDPTFRYRTVADLIASTRVGGGVGTQWFGGNFAYVEAEPNASDYHVQTSGGVRLYLDEPEADPLGFPAVIGTDDTANFMRALEYAEKITLDPRREYKIHNILEVTRPVIIDLNGARVSAAPGFTDAQLMKILTSDVRFSGGGTLDGTNLPPMITDFIGTDFTSITLYALGTSGAPLSGVDLDRVKIIGGECAALYATYCPGLRLHNIVADGINASNVYDVAATISINQATRAQLDVLKVLNARQKGISLSNSNNGQGGRFQVHNLHAGHAGIFMNGCSAWDLTGLSTYGGFGIKLDNSSFNTLTGLNVDCAGNGLGGVMVQGGTNNNVVGGTIKSFTEYGLSVTYHGSKNLSVTETTASDLNIYGNSSTPQGSGLAAVAILADATYGAYGTVLNNIKMRSVDIGVYCRDNAGAALIDRVELNGCRGYDIKSFFAKGIALNFTSVGGSIAGSIGALDVFRIWSQAQGSVLSIKDFDARELSTSANLLATGSGFGTTQYAQVVVDGCTMVGGRSVLYANLGTSSNRINSLRVQNNDARGLSQVKGLDLNSASATVTQVNITGNTLLNATDAKQNIYFSNATKFNGVVGNNMATPVNTPSNV